MSAPKFEQVTEGKWPSGSDKSLAVVHQEPDELMVRLGIMFREQTDELGPLREAGLRLASGRQLLLIRWTLRPMDGTEILIDSMDDSSDAFQDILAAFDLHPDDVTWLNPEVTR